jgi:hypothetical protein
VVERLAEALTPHTLAEVPPIEQSYGSELTGWRQFAEQGPPADLDRCSLHNLDRLAELEATWSDLAAGDTLLHTDLRPDNMLYRKDGSVVMVDWAWPCRGTAWVDLVSLMPSLLADGIDPDPILTTHPVTADADPAAITASRSVPFVHVGEQFPVRGAGWVQFLVTVVQLGLQLDSSPPSSRGRSDAPNRGGPRRDWLDPFLPGDMVRRRPGAGCDLEDSPVVCNPLAQRVVPAIAAAVATLSNIASNTCTSGRSNGTPAATTRWAAPATSNLRVPPPATPTSAERFVHQMIEPPERD